ncbi:MAG: hypothetical protein K6G75_08780 [Lachnospiraceae bacterium]|nr:hypothetical protein [Lachnospiraceae bacterium]
MGRSLKTNIRLRLRKSLALLMSFLVFMGTVNIPTRVIAAEGGNDSSAVNASSLNVDDFFLQGESIYIDDDVYSAIVIQYDAPSSVVFMDDYIRPRNGFDDSIQDVTDIYDRTYYKNATFDFPERTEIVDTNGNPFPDESSIYILTNIEETTAEIEDNDVPIKKYHFNQYYGIKIKVFDKDQSTLLDTLEAHFKFNGSELNERESVPAELNAVEADSIRGDNIGWSTNPGFMGYAFEEDSDTPTPFAYVFPEDEVAVIDAYDFINSADANGNVSVYPIFEYLEPKTAGDDFYVTMQSYYEDAEEADIPEPQVVGYSGYDKDNPESYRDAEFIYYKADNNYAIIDDPENEGVEEAPAETGYYAVKAIVEGTPAVIEEDRLISLGYSEETAIGGFKVKGKQDSIVFNPDEKTAYVGVFGKTLLIQDLVTGVKDDADVHFKLTGSNFRGYGEDRHYIGGADNGCKVQIIVYATDLYDRYESEPIPFPIVFLPFPEEEVTLSSEKLDVKVGDYDTYKGPLTITPPEGYLISDDYSYEPDITFKEDLTVDNTNGSSVYVFLQRKTDGAVTERTNLFGDNVWIDSDAPKVYVTDFENSFEIDGEKTKFELSEESKNEIEGQTVEFDIVDAYSIFVDDDNDDNVIVTYYPSLKSVTVNGEEVAFDEEHTNEKAHVTLINEGPVTKDFTVVATDVVGNVSEWTISLTQAVEETPDPAFTISGTEGERGFYTSEVELIAPEGYKISDDLEGEYSDAIVYDEELEQIWLYNTETKRFTDAIEVEPILIDMDEPEFSEMGLDDEGTEIEIIEEGSYKVKTLTLEVYDDNLYSVTVNEEEVEIEEEGKASIVLKAGKTEKDYSIVAEDEAGNISELNVTLEVYGEASAVVNPVEKLVYNGTSQELVSVEDVINGTVVFSSSKDGDYSETIPAGKNAGDYTVWYRVIGDEYYSDIDHESIAVSIYPQPVGLRWSDTEFKYDGEEHCPSAEATRLVNGDECDVIVEGAAKEVGKHIATATSLSNPNYCLPANIADVVGDSSNALSDLNRDLLSDKKGSENSSALSAVVADDTEETSIEFVITGVASCEVKAIDGLIYNGEDQNLIEALENESGKVVFSASENGEFSETIPTGKAAGSYEIWYKVLGNEYYEDSEPQKLSASIAPKTAGLNWSETKFKYDGNEHCPKAEVTNLESGDSCAVTVEGVASEVGKHTAKATALSNPNYSLPTDAEGENDSDASVEFVITGVASCEVKAIEGLTYNGSEQALVEIVSSENGKVVFALSEDGEYTDSIPTGKNAGKYEVWYKAVGDEYCEDSAPESVETEISKQTLNVSWSSETTFTYDGVAHKPEVSVTDADGSAFDVIYSIMGDEKEVENAVSAGKYVAVINLTEEDYANHEISDSDKSKVFVIEKANPIVIGPDDVEPVYNGEEQKLVSGLSATNGKILYRLIDETAVNAINEKNSSNSTDALGEDSTEDEESEFTEEIPTGKDAKTYTIIYKVIGDENYNDLEPKELIVKIAPKTVSLKWSETEFKYDGNEHCPNAEATNLVSGDSCTVTVEGSASEVGKHTATAVELSNSNYALPSSGISTEFVITGEASCVVKPYEGIIYNGNDQELVQIVSVVNGTVVFATSENGEFTSSLPKGSNVGTYQIWYKALGNEYCTDSSVGKLSVSISPKTIGLKWSNTEFEYDGKEHCPIAEATGLAANDTCEVKVTGAASQPGNHTATAVSVSNSNYKLPENPQTGFVIKKKEDVPPVPKNEGRVSVSISGFYYGGTPGVVSISSQTNDVSKAVVRFKKSGSSDGTYSATMPTEVGDYTVKVSLPETGNYKACSATASFTIAYLPVPAGSYKISGTNGEGDWFVSDVFIVPGEGFEISLNDRNSFSSDSIKIEEGFRGGKLYIRKKSTGEMTDGITIGNMLIDKDAPSIKDMEKGGIYFADETGILKGIASDKNIYKIFVDDNEVDFSIENGNYVFDLPIGKKKQRVTVKVVDVAGNETMIEIITAPKWLKEGIISEGEFYLELGEEYKTPEGSSWSVDDEKTEYKGGIVFYTRVEGDKYFHKR